jgi:hypothetical protein
VGEIAFQSVSLSGYKKSPRFAFLKNYPLSLALALAFFFFLPSEHIGSRRVFFSVSGGLRRAKIISARAENANFEIATDNESSTEKVTIASGLV